MNKTSLLVNDSVQSKSAKALEIFNSITTYEKSLDKAPDSYPFTSFEFNEMKLQSKTDTLPLNGLNDFFYKNDSLIKSNYASAFEKSSDTEPIQSAYMSLFADFKKVLKSSDVNDRVNILGLYEEICENTEVYIKSMLSEIPDGPRKQTALHLLKLLKFEKRTWRLVLSIYHDRIFNFNNESQMDNNEFDNNFKSEVELINDYMKNDNKLRQAQIVVDWLEKNASEDLDNKYENLDQHLSGVMWENSLHQLKKFKERSKIVSSKSITEMDPDAPTRQKCSLNDLDLNDENELLNVIYDHIRAGRIVEAQEICIKHGQAWRAAALEGFRLYHDPNFVCSSKNFSLTNGNPTRQFWKSTCWDISENCNYSLKERAVFGALSGNLSAMLENCKNWEDVVWANYKALLDIMVEKKLKETYTIRKPIQKQLDLKANSVVNLPENFWNQKLDLNSQENIFQAISSTSNVEIRLQSKLPFSVTHECIILNSVGKLVDEILSWIKNTNFDPQLLRFATHLIMFLKDIGEDVETEKFNDILYKYVSFLSSDFKTSCLVAEYCSSLPKNLQVDAYVKLLVPIEEFSLRREYFSLGEEAGLQIQDITTKVVEKIKQLNSNDYDFHLNSNKEDNLELFLKQSTTSLDLKLIQSIEWLVIDPTQRHEAIYQCNTIMRNFIAAGKYKAALQAYDKLPSDSVDTIYTQWEYHSGSKSQPLPYIISNSIKERLCIHSYIEAHVAFSNWFEHLHSKKPKSNTAKSTNLNNFPGKVSLKTLYASEINACNTNEMQLEWNRRLERHCKIVSEKIFAVLLFPGGWLVDNIKVEEDKDTDFRNHQLDLLRKFCIPMLCSLLLTVFKETPSKASEIFKLVHVIADENQKIYKLFTKNEGAQFFIKLQEIMVEHV